MLMFLVALAAVLAPAASGDPLAGFSPAERQLLTDHLRHRGVPLSKVHTLAKEDGIVIPGCMEEEDLPADEDFEDLEGKEDAEYLCKEEEKPRFEQCELDHGCHHSQLQYFSGRDICRCLGVGFRCGVEQCRLPHAPPRCTAASWATSRSSSPTSWAAPPPVTPTVS
eukprot:TRINITY_DN7762_c0_g1_i1.p2 TRINITY_DN7762_c0_g1~~TRINITY_DN7762_c0_g1_i1.p2  ORF type:complete len:174 (-),score=59.84 TRINITY_DN7762_c0_g1_i1:426-926(-)